jgi:hypothetical protein
MTATNPRGPLSPAERRHVEDGTFTSFLAHNIAKNLDDALRAKTAECQALQSDLGAKNLLWNSLISERDALKTRLRALTEVARTHYCVATERGEECSACKSLIANGLKENE